LEERRAVLLSLLIPTLKCRAAVFQDLLTALNGQISTSPFASKVEVLCELDGGEASIGRKRNNLIARASGLFIAFIDDDDQVSADYIERICMAIERDPGIDCIGIKGIITFRGAHPREFIHSVRYGDYFSRHHTYFRPPYHLNPMRREIAARYRFPEVSYSEDIDWALRIRRDGALKKEQFIDSTLYYYRSRRVWTYQWLLDLTEGFRHRFGIRLANRLALQSAIRAVARKTNAAN
jgi:glycosyltransferase involved in cell wall biosynthesis